MGANMDLAFSMENYTQLEPLTLVIQGIAMNDQLSLKSAWLVTRKFRNVMYYIYVVLYCCFAVCINSRAKT